MNTKAIILSIVIAIGGYGAWVVLSDLDEVIVVTQRVGILGITIALILSLANYALRYLRWHYMIVRVSGQTLPHKRHLLYYIAGFALTTTPGKAGEAIRSVYLKTHDVKYTQSIAALFTERLSDMLSVLLIAIAALYYFEDYRWVGISLGSFTVVMILMIQSTAVRTQIRHCCQRYAPKKLYQALDHGLNVFDQSAQLLGPRFFLAGLLVGVIAWGAEAVGFALIVHFMDIPVSPLLLAGIYATGMLVGAISFLPGGLGGAEAAMALMLTVIGLSAGESASATILCRIATLWFAVLLGLCAMSLLETRKVNNDSSKPMNDNEGSHKPS